FCGNVFIDCGDGGNRITNHTDFSDCQRVLILADRQSAVENGEICTYKDGLNARIGFCLVDVDIDDARMRNRTSQKFGMQHSWKYKVICILQFADALRLGVDFDEELSNYAQVISLAAAVIPSHKPSPWQVPPYRRGYAQPPTPPLPVF